MTVLLVVFMLLAFVGIDFVVRDYTRRAREKRERLERATILDSQVRIEFAGEVKTLKRVALPKAKARILAVDDEAVVLDSFRRILVLEGYDIDTVETGPEALTLVQRNDYDFVFTDLKMPDMDGVEVVKAVKHLRPDVDMVVITGYGTIETAVETLRHGACEYVQKPFTADELAEFVNKLLVKRQARQASQALPTVRIVAPGQAEAGPGDEYSVPGGAFLAPGHTWVRIESDGALRLGIDDFIRKAVGAPGKVVLPEAGLEVTAGQPLFFLQRDGATLAFHAPVSGTVLDANWALEADPAKVVQSPYTEGWICRIQPGQIQAELAGLLIGQPVVAWYGEETLRLRSLGSAQPDWGALQPFLG